MYWRRIIAAIVLLSICVLSLYASGQVAGAQDTQPAAGQEEEQPPAPAAGPEDAELAQMRKELERLQTEYQLMQQRQKNALAELELRKQELTAESALRKAERDAELDELRANVERMQAEASLRQAEQGQELADMKAAMERRQTAQQLDDLGLKEELAELNGQLQRINTESALKMAESKLSQSEVMEIQQRFAVELAEWEAALKKIETRGKYKDVAAGDIDYVHEPLQDGVLYITDRRIALDGAIADGSADYVCNRIDFFNNQSEELPIFIVIGYNPGGSVMEGYRIVKAIRTSPAPVYVVVKSFAASMAAVITTLADHSYAYPNAIILHHQMSSGMYGNLTQQKEQLENGLEWARRLADPVAQKMGVSYEQFVEMMYEHNSNGDWEEFADEAVKLKWVDNTIDEIREVGVRQRPTTQPWSSFLWQAEEVDENGDRFVRLPRLRPFDHYFLYNPDGYYRTE